MSFTARAVEQSTQDIEITAETPEGRVSLGWWFRLRRLTSRELDVHRGYMLLMVGVPTEDHAALARDIRGAIESGDNLSQSIGGFVGAYLSLMRANMTPENSKRGEDMRAAILAAGVTHWSDDGVTWRPVRVLVDTEPTDGDGSTTPDVIGVRHLPGGGGTETALVEKLLTMSQAGAAEARRLASFRRES